jgi:signal transduction histidine kinase
MKNKNSLYFTLGIIIITTVVIIMSINSSISYTKMKSEIINNIKQSSRITILSLKSNISNLLASYSINEYNKLISNEMERKDILAIIVNDYNMAKIMGKESYITGKIKDINYNITNYNSQNKEHNKILQNSYLKNTYNILWEEKKLGTISIYISDKIMNQELDRIIFENLRNTLIISFLLIVVLFFSIRFFLLKPISNIIKVINICDENGIPSKYIPLNSATKEIDLLSNTLNNMIASIKSSRTILENSENKLKYLLEMSPIAVRIAKNNGENLIFANNTYSKLLHINKKKLTVEHPKNFYTNEDVYDEVIKTLGKNENIYNKLVQLKVKDKIIWALASYVNINFDGEDSIIGWFYDITNEIQTENKLFQALELQTTIFDNSGYMIIRCEKNGIIKQMNKEAIKILGYEASELIDKCTPEIIHLESEIIERSKEFSKKLNIIVNPGFEVFIIESNLSNSNEHEWTYITKEGKLIPILLSISELKDKNNNIYGYLGVAKDITQRKVMESQAKLASMGEMIGNIAHQWRQPLNVISTIASGIKIKSEYDQLDISEILPDMTNIINQTQYLSDTIDDFRDFIRNSNNKENITIRETIGKTLSITSSSMITHNINIILNIEDDIMIQGFKNQLIQAFINILTNAKDALNEKNLPNKLIFIDTKVVSKNLILTIKDNAGGIPKEVINKIFEPYFTTKHKSIGTGIGLSMVYQIITSHHNTTIEVSNKTYDYNKITYSGACFEIIFKADK